MLTNRQLIPETETHVKFISYMGRYPNLCSGDLVLEIDGEKVRFDGYDRFWNPPNIFDISATGEWTINVEDIPAQYRKYAAEIDQVFNANVEKGHCGGCR